MLKEMKIRPRESYCSVVKRLIQLKINEKLLFPETILKIKRALKEIEKEKYILLPK